MREGRLIVGALRLEGKYFPARRAGLDRSVLSSACFAGSSGFTLDDGVLKRGSVEGALLAVVPQERGILLSNLGTC